MRPCPIDSSLTPFFWVVKRSLYKVGIIKHGVGHRHGIVGMLSNEELDVLEPEGVLGVDVIALAVFAWPEKVKKATQVRLLMAVFIGVVPWAAVSKAWIMLTRMGRTLFRGESSF